MSITTSEAIAILRPIPLFSTLTDEQLEKVFLLASYEQYGEDRPLITEGDNSEEVFVILSGEVEVQVALPDAKGNETVAVLKAGDVLGEMGLVEMEKRSATALPRGIVTALFWNSDSLLTLFQMEKDIGYEVMRQLTAVLASRLVKTTQNLSNLFFQAIYKS